jgi:hypothetical protein
MRLLASMLTLIRVLRQDLADRTSSIIWSVWWNRRCSQHSGWYFRNLRAIYVLAAVAFYVTTESLEVTYTCPTSLNARLEI